MTRQPTLGSLTAALALLLGACSKPAAPREIVLGVLADLTGPTADVGRPYHEGMLAYIDHLNAQGGVQGRPIRALAEDYGYKVPTAEEKYKKYVQAAAVAVQGWGTGDSEALRRKVAADQLPFMSASYAEAAATGKYELFKTTSIYDGTATHPEWLGEEPKEVQRVMQTS